MCTARRQERTREEATARCPDADRPGVFSDMLLRALANAGIAFALATDCDAWLAGGCETDLDILVEPGQVADACKAVTGAARAVSADVIVARQDEGTRLLFVQADPLKALPLRIIGLGRHVGRGCCCPDWKGRLSRVTSGSPIPQLSPEDMAAYRFCTEVLGALQRGQRPNADLRDICRAGPERLEMWLQKAFGVPPARRLMRACRAGRFGRVARMCRRWRPAAALLGFAGNPLKASWGLLDHVLHRCALYLRPNGIVAVVMGSDGSGKGTVIEAVRRLLARGLHLNVRVCHWRPWMLPSLRTLRTGRPEVHTPVTDPHVSESSSRLVSVLRVAYYTLDYVLGYWLSVRPGLERNYAATIFDRYFYDYFVDSARFVTAAPEWALRFFSAFVPKPDVIAFLEADAETIHSRKPELSVEELRRQMTALRALSTHLDNSVRLDASRPPGCSASELVLALTEALRRPHA